MTCAVLPKIDENAPLDDAIVENYGALVDYVLYRLFGAETESATSQQKSAFHYKQFLDGILVKEQIRQAFLNKGIATQTKGAKK